VTTSVVAEAAAAARRGELIVLPTDTVYGVGTRPDDPEATARLFAAKSRPAGLTLPVLAATVREAREVAAFDERADRLTDACWPGPLTLVLPRTDRSAGWALGGSADTVGVRVPAHPLARAILAQAGPLAVSSANRSGRPPARTCDELVRAFGDLVAVYLCQDEPLEGSPSTVLDLTHARASLLREGSVSAERITALLSG
jgi:tRNA threonylcarbamoyl adenosine modification protein (Sua5/YciO/YrdC/YwlC family)